MRVRLRLSHGNAPAAQKIQRDYDFWRGSFSGWCRLPACPVQPGRPHHNGRLNHARFLDRQRGNHPAGGDPVAAPATLRPPSLSQRQGRAHKSGRAVLRLGREWSPRETAAETAALPEEWPHPSATYLVWLPSLAFAPPPPDTPVRWFHLMPGRAQADATDSDHPRDGMGAVR
jgi:hypothetical protein